MSFNNSKKIEVLNADVTKVLLAPPKLNFLSSVSTASSSKKKPPKDDDRAMVDVSDVEQKLAAIPQQGDLRLLGPPSGRDADGGARTRDRRVPADLRAHAQATVPPTPPQVVSCPHHSETRKRGSML
ncbi:hypothetical protein PoB_000363000 [Plakobranchus ocellatus]|uniref:Uncharacterized protein n=1 Tax=Plakobranchus ocellatus TaxID=259542 RepID=A0AAV3Y380_9GAST|nr:hypothetical protein PoB_000363000 [Plakobranchus ocellatus]